MQLPPPPAPGQPQAGSRLTLLWQRVRAFLAAGHPLVQLRVLVLLAVGWLLSPLCWWNDLVINLPIAYGVGVLVGHWRPEWFAGGLVAGYWLSNVVGIVLMQTSAMEVFQDPENPGNLRRELLMGLLTSSVYTVAVFALVHFGVLHTPLPELELT
ncbi:hypothetical protein [Vulcanococcus limneticus]|uniref:hypothetical protein n=1 Tax=Vulcanococcus limneticus TaxID=2170428 RepID=UPI0012FF8FC0|nr:hypothetical protein [Vulcanococcus limneticus]